MESSHRSIVDSSPQSSQSEGRMSSGCEGTWCAANDRSRSIASSEPWTVGLGGKRRERAATTIEFSGIRTS